jgi:hypothetical protein
LLRFLQWTREKGNKEMGYHKPEPRRASLHRNSRLEEEEEGLQSAFGVIGELARPKKIVTEHRQNMDPEPSQHPNEFSGIA